MIEFSNQTLSGSSWHLHWTYLRIPDSDPGNSNTCYHNNIFKLMNNSRAPNASKNSPLSRRLHSIGASEPTAYGNLNPLPINYPQSRFRCLVLLRRLRKETRFFLVDSRRSLPAYLHRVQHVPRPLQSFLSLDGAIRRVDLPSA
jgi:hypothetical protein